MLLLGISQLNLVTQNVLLLSLSFLVIKHAWLFLQGQFCLCPVATCALNIPEERGFTWQAYIMTWFEKELLPTNTFISRT